VVFTTAYDEHALEAFEAQAVGYLLKPCAARSSPGGAPRRARPPRRSCCGSAEQSQLGRRRAHICTRAGQRLDMIPVEDVFYFSAGQKYVTVRHRGGEGLIEESLRALDAEFAPDFVRIHRNSLVAVRHVGAVERTADGQYVVRIAGSDEASR